MFLARNVSPKPVTDPVKLRTIYLKVQPSPSGLSERRSVLNALKQFGEIEVFKKLGVRTTIPESLQDGLQGRVASKDGRS
jgi:hypothetical protein